MRSTALLWLSIEECRALLAVIATWESLHGLKVDDITKEHTSLARNVLFLFMGMKDEVQQTKDHTRDHTKDHTKTLSTEVSVLLRACSIRALHLELGLVPSTCQEIRSQIFYSTQSQVHGVNKHHLWA